MNTTSRTEGAEPVVIDTARGVFHGFTTGPARGPLVLALHGFPDVPHGYFSLAALLAAEGYRVVMPFMRGYAPSPLDGPFTTEALSADVAALSDALAPDERPSLLGHDWGAVAVYAALGEHRGRFARAVTMAVPHPLSFVAEAVRSPAQLWRSWYMGFFQLPFVAERAVSAGDFALIERLYRVWSPGLSASSHLVQVKRCLAQSMPCPIAYYRAMVRPVGEAITRLREGASRRISTPTLHLAGREDGCIGVHVGEGQSRYFDAPFESRVIDGAGHFMHIERPAEVAAHVLRHLSA